MNEVIVLSGASSQVLKIFSRFEDESEGMGNVFYSEFLEACERLAQFPETAPRFDERFRRLLMPKWRIGIFYSISALRIMVSAVMDLRQDPDTIRRYLESL